MTKNIFKTNSRFDVLREDFVNKKNNKNENQSSKENQKNKEKTKSKEITQLNKEEKKINKKLEKSDYVNKKINLIEENFPQLTNVTKKENKIQEEKKINYIDKVNILKKTNIISNVEDEVKPGWVKLEKNKITKQVTIKYGKRTYLSDDERLMTPEDVLNNLINLHERRKNEYIRDWGEESYEKTFRFVDYDYDYFDRLDEEYEINQIDEGTFSDEELEYNY
jgi:phenylalanyl-tRNA synthetase alpha subunit